MAKKELYSNFRGAKIVKVIRLEINEGEGKSDDPVRRVVYWLDLDGNIIAHDDPIDRKFRGES
jgi:hypothetical protein